MDGLPQATRAAALAARVGTWLRDEEDALSVAVTCHAPLACEDRSRWLALLPGVVADLGHSSVFCFTGEGLAGRSGS